MAKKQNFVKKPTGSGATGAIKPPSLLVPIAAALVGFVVIVLLIRQNGFMNRLPQPLGFLGGSGSASLVGEASTAAESAAQRGEFYNRGLFIGLEDSKAYSGKRELKIQDKGGYYDDSEKYTFIVDPKIKISVQYYITESGKGNETVALDDLNEFSLLDVYSKPNRDGHLEAVRVVNVVRNVIDTEVGEE